MRPLRMRAHGLAAGALVLSCILSGCGGGSSSFAPPSLPSTPLTITTSSLPRATTGQAYSATLTATGGTAPYTWNLDINSASLPPGLRLNSNGTISGTPTQWAYSTLLFDVRDAAGRTTSIFLQVECFDPLVIGYTSLPDGNIATPYFWNTTVSGGEPPYRWDLAAGSNPFPPGLGFDQSHYHIQGLPTQPGSFTLTLQVTDSGSPAVTVTQTVSLLIKNGLAIPPTTLSIGVVNDAYSDTLNAAGGQPPYTWALTQGSSLPAGLTLGANTGAITGTPTAATSYSYYFSVQVTDSAPQPATVQGNFSILIRPPLAFTAAVFPDGPKGQGYYGPVPLEGGKPPLTVIVADGSLPTGLSLAVQDSNNTYFALTGGPTTNGLFQFTLQATDSGNPISTASKKFQIRISDPLTVTAPGPLTLLEGSSLSETFTASGGYPPYTWQTSALPAGISFDPTTATLSGTVGSSFSNGNTYASIQLNVNDSSSPPFWAYSYANIYIVPKLRITTSALPPVATGSTVSLVPQATGGVIPYKWSVTSGALPAGLVFDSATGTISGVPTTAGSYPVTITLTDSGTGNLAQTTTQSWTIVVKDRGQMTRNDTIAQATPLSNGAYQASISPYSDPSSSGADVDVYQVSAVPGTTVSFSVQAIAPPNAPSYAGGFLPVVELLDGTGTRFQTCAPYLYWPFTSPCVTGLDGNFGSSTQLFFQAPGSGTTPVTFYLRVLDARGDARPDFLYTFSVSGVN